MFGPYACTKESRPQKILYCILFFVYFLYSTREGFCVHLSQGVCWAKSMYWFSYSSLNSGGKFKCPEGPSWLHNMGRKYDCGGGFLPTKGHLKQPSKQTNTKKIKLKLKANVNSLSSCSLTLEQHGFEFYGSTDT